MLPAKMTITRSMKALNRKIQDKEKVLTPAHRIFKAYEEIK